MDTKFKFLWRVIPWLPIIFILIGLFGMFMLEVNRSASMNCDALNIDMKKTNDETLLKRQECIETKTCDCFRKLLEKDKEALKLSLIFYEKCPDFPEDIPERLVDVFSKAIDIDNMSIGYYCKMEQIIIQNDNRTPPTKSSIVCDTVYHSGQDSIVNKEVKGIARCFTPPKNEIINLTGELLKFELHSRDYWDVLDTSTYYVREREDEYVSRFLEISKITNFELDYQLRKSNSWLCDYNLSYSLEIQIAIEKCYENDAFIGYKYINRTRSGTYRWYGEYNLI